MKRHLALTGFMAAGKSTVGKKLARTLGVKFYDVDDLIVAAHGPISEIFYEQGEARFREYEYEAIAQVLRDGEPGIIALGGGALTHEPTLKLLKKQAYRVFIKVAPEQIVSRLRKSPRIRPLLGPAPSLQKVKELYTKRMSQYAHADFVVEAEETPTAQIVAQIVQWMHRKNISV